jgi:hypothetical protein
VIESPFVLAIDSPVPESLRPSALGVGLNGPPDELFLVFGEEFTPQERETIRSGDYVVAVKLLQRDGVAGLVWRLDGRGLGMNGFANYSLRHVRERLGEESLAGFRDAARSASLAGSPGHGLLLRLVFVDPHDGIVFGLRLFTLPRLFSDRWLAAILGTADQDPARSDELVEELLGTGSEVWTLARPGIAVAGEEIELDEGDFVRLLRKQRTRRDRT